MLEKGANVCYNLLNGLKKEMGRSDNKKTK